MNAIKLPVRIYQMRNSTLWTLSQADNAPLHYEGTEEHAQQIAHALNLHDDLVGALKEISRRYPGNHITGNIARQAIARAETTNETK